MNKPIIREIHLYNADGRETEATIQLDLRDAALLLAECNDEEQARFIEVFAHALNAACENKGKYIFQVHWIFDQCGEIGKEFFQIISEGVTKP